MAGTYLPLGERNGQTRYQYRANAFAHCALSYDLNNDRWVIGYYVDGGAPWPTHTWNGAAHPPNGPLGEYTPDASGDTGTLTISELEG